MVAYIIVQYRADLMTTQKPEMREDLTSAEILPTWTPYPTLLSTMTKTAIFEHDARRLTQRLLRIVKACPVQIMGALLFKVLN